MRALFVGLILLGSSSGVAQASSSDPIVQPGALQGTAWASAATPSGSFTFQPGTPSACEFRDYPEGYAYNEKVSCKLSGANASLTFPTLGDAPRVFQFDQILSFSAPEANSYLIYGVELPSRSGVQPSGRVRLDLVLSNVYPGVWRGHVWLLDQAGDVSIASKAQPPAF